MKQTLFLLFFLVAISTNVTPLISENFAIIQDIEYAPVILSNHDTGNNSLKESVCSLLSKADSSILLISFTFTDKEFLKIINNKAENGVNVHLIIDRDHLAELKTMLHPRARGCRIIAKKVY